MEAKTCIVMILFCICLVGIFTAAVICLFPLPLKIFPGHNFQNTVRPLLQDIIKTISTLLNIEIAI
jgi:hypothetical protein